MEYRGIITSLNLLAILLFVESFVETWLEEKGHDKIQLVKQ